MVHAGSGEFLFVYHSAHLLISFLKEGGPYIFFKEGEVE